MAGPLIRSSVAALACVAGVAEAQRPQVQWLVASFPPSTISAGPQKGLGYLDRILSEELFPALPQFEHKVVAAQPARAYLEAERLANACLPSAIRTPERTLRYHVSEPMFRFLPHGLAVRRQDLALVRPALRDSGEVDLGRLLGEMAWSLGVVAGRRYGGTVDDLLARLPQQVVALNGPESNLTLMRMLALERSFPAAMAYGFDLRFLEERYPDLRGKLAWLPVAGFPPASFSRVICSKTPQGLAIVQAINQTLPQVRERMQQHYEAWLDDDSRALLARQRRELRRDDLFWTEP